VKDRGTGLTADKLDKIFQPFYTTKRAVWDGAFHQPLDRRRSRRAALGRDKRGPGATFYFTVGVEGAAGNEGRGSGKK
jgi:hypothetical protein